MFRKPSPQEIRDWLKGDFGKWFLEITAYHLNEIDTVSNIKDIDGLKKIATDQLGAKKAKDIIIDILSDIFEAGEIEEHQKKVADKEDNVIKSLKDFEE